MWLTLLWWSGTKEPKYLWGVPIISHPIQTGVFWHPPGGLGRAAPTQGTTRLIKQSRKPSGVKCQPTWGPGTKASQPLAGTLTGTHPLEQKYSPSWATGTATEKSCSHNNHRATQGKILVKRIFLECLQSHWDELLTFFLNMNILPGSWDKTDLYAASDSCETASPEAERLTEHGPHFPTLQTHSLGFEKWIYPGNTSSH